MFAIEINEVRKNSTRWDEPIIFPPTRLASAPKRYLVESRLVRTQLKNAVCLRAVPTFSEFVDSRYLPFIKNYKRSWPTDHSILRNHLLTRLGRIYLDQITKNDVTAIHHGRRAAGAAPASANRVLVLLRYMFNLALKWEVPGVTKNPTSGVPLFKENNKRERYLSVEETRRLHAAVLESANSQLRFIVPMLLLTGARKREVLDARWENFDLIRRQWRIPLSKNGKARHVPISNELAQLLQMVPRFEGCGYVVPNPKTLSPFVSFFHSWNTARTQAGLEDLRVHDLRHSFASFLINSGRSLYEIQQILGHAQVHTTQRYAHLSQTTLLDAANAAVQAIGVTFAPADSQVPTSESARK